MSQCCSVTSCSCSAGCGDDVQQRYSSWDREKGCIDLTLTMMLGEHGIIFKAHPDEPLRHSIMFICPLLPVARQSKRKDFCKSLSDFSRQFNNFFLRKTKNKKHLFSFKEFLFFDSDDMVFGLLPAGGKARRKAAFSQLWQL